MESDKTYCRQCGKPTTVPAPCPFCGFREDAPAPPASPRAMPLTNPTAPRLDLVKPLADLTRWTVRLLLFQALVQLFTLSMIVALSLEAEGEDRFRIVMELQNSLNPVNCFQSLAWLAATILFLIWQYGVRMNYERLGVQALGHSPAMGIVWWFIPIANLFMPYMVLQELWRAGATTEPSAQGQTAWRKTPACPVTRLYWIVKIGCLVVMLAIQVSIVIFSLSARRNPRALGSELLPLLMATLIVSMLGAIAQVFLEIFIVERVTRRQEALRIRVTEMVQPGSSESADQSTGPAQA